MHVVALILWLSTQPAFAASIDTVGTCDSLTYEPDTVRLSGRLERHTYPGRPNYESIAKGDEAETGFYLRPEEPICLSHGKTDIDDEPATGVKLVQLVLDARGYDRLRPRLGQRVTVRGTLFHSETGHHHATLLLWVIWH
jgi:hypothetical protein